MVAVADGFVCPGDCAHIIALARGAMQRAKVSLDETAGVIPGRSGLNCWLRYRDDPVVMKVGELAAKLVDLPLRHAEALQVIHYDPAQEYRAHYDAYNLALPRGQRCCRFGHQRIVTVLIYLNNVIQGGSTEFPKLNVSIEPRLGRAVVFNNVGPSLMEPHPASLHTGRPVLQGEKWACNLWFHARPIEERQVFAVAHRKTQPGCGGPAALESPPGAGGVNDASANPESASMICLRVNRASRVWDDALDRIRTQEAQAIDALPGPACLSYWDTYGGNQLSLRGLPDPCRLIKLMDREVFNPLANKWAFYQAVVQAGLHDLVPWSGITAAAALAHDCSASSLWFVKPALLSGGRGIRCIHGADLHGLVLEKNVILQRAVDDLLLWEGKKFTARIYVLIWNQCLFLCSDGFVLVHGVMFDPDSTDYAVHVDHRGYNDPASAVMMMPLSSCASLNSYRSAFPDLVRALRPVLARCVGASSVDRYALLGVDLLLQRSGTIKIVEVNTMPNFIHSPQIIRDVNVPLFADILARVVLDVERPGLMPISG
jgi:hypothetical protein